MNFCKRYFVFIYFSKIPDPAATVETGQSKTEPAPKEGASQPPTNAKATSKQPEAVPTSETKEKPGKTKEMINYQNVNTSPSATLR